MPHKGKKRFTNKQLTVIRVINKKKKKRLKLKLIPKKGTVIIKNLSFKATEDCIRDYFKKFGDISQIKLLRDAHDNLVGRGIIQFSKKKSAAIAIQNCNGNYFMDRKIVADWAVPHLEKRNNTVTVLKVKEEPEDDPASVKTENADPAEECRHIETDRKYKVLGTEVIQNTEAKECKKIKNAKKGRLVVRNLPFKVTEAVLRKHFEKYGDITEVKLLRKADGKLVGCGFIQFVKKNSAAKAILSCSGKPLLGRTIIVDWAIPKSVFSTSEPSPQEEAEIKKEDLDDVEVLGISASNVDGCVVETTEIKREPLSDDSEEGNDTCHKSAMVEGSCSEEEMGDTDEENIELRNKTDIKRTRVISNDVSEGRTVFIKNVPFSANNDDLKNCMEQFGQVIYALVCIDPVTEHSKGTAFVKFQTQESARECLAAGTELTLLSQTLDVYEALNKHQLQEKADLKHTTHKNKDNRNLYLVKEGVVMAGSRAAVGVSIADMEKRLQLEQWKSQMLRNFNMFVSRFRLVVHNLPPSWNDTKLHHLFLQHAGPKAVIKEARVMRDKKNVDSQGIGKSKEFGFVSFTTHEHALQALRNINNNPNIFTSTRRPIVAFSIENKAVMNIKQKRLVKSQAKNPLCTDQCIAKRAYKKKLLQKDEDLDQQRTKNGNVVGEETEEFVGVTAKPGNTNLRTRFGLQTQAKIHKQAVHKAKHRQKMKSRFVQHKHSTMERKKDPQPKQGVKRKHDEEDTVFNKLVNQYKKKLMAAPMKKWYDE